MAETINAAQLEKEAEIVETTVDNKEVVESSGDSFTSIIRQSIKDGARRYNDIKVRNVICELNEDGESARITFVTNKALPFYQMNEDGVYVETTSNNIFTSNYAIAGMMKNFEDIAWLANEVNACVAKAHEEEDNKYLRFISALFTGSTIDVLSKFVPMDGEYINPFSTKTEKTVYSPEHDIYINNVIRITLGKGGKNVANLKLQTLIDF